MTSSGPRRQRLAQPRAHRDRRPCCCSRPDRPRGARRSSSGVLYIVLCVLGFIATGDDGIGFVAENDALIDLVPVNNEDNVLHLILGFTGVIAAFATAAGGQAAPASEDEASSPLVEPRSRT